MNIKDTALVAGYAIGIRRNNGNPDVGQVDFAVGSLVGILAITFIATTIAGLALRTIGI